MYKPVCSCCHVSTRSVLLRLIPDYKLLKAQPKTHCVLKSYPHLIHSTKKTSQWHNVITVFHLLSSSSGTCLQYSVFSVIISSKCSVPFLSLYKAFLNMEAEPIGWCSYHTNMKKKYFFFPKCEVSCESLEEKRYILLLVLERKFLSETLIFTRLGL